MFDKKKKDEEPKEAIFASNIQRRKAALSVYLASPMGQLARSAVKFWPDQHDLDARFQTEETTMTSSRSERDLVVEFLNRSICSLIEKSLEM